MVCQATEGAFPRPAAAGAGQATRRVGRPYVVGVTWPSAVSMAASTESVRPGRRRSLARTWIRTGPPRRSTHATPSGAERAPSTRAGTTAPECRSWIAGLDGQHAEALLDRRGDRAVGGQPARRHEHVGPQPDGRERAPGGREPQRGLVVGQARELALAPAVAEGPGGVVVAVQGETSSPRSRIQATSSAEASAGRSRWVSGTPRASSAATNASWTTPPESDT